MSMIPLTSAHSIIKLAVKQAVDACEEVIADGSKLIFQLLPDRVIWEASDDKALYHGAGMTDGVCSGCLVVAEKLTGMPAVMLNLRKTGEHWPVAPSKALGLMRRRLATLERTQDELIKWGRGHEVALFRAAMEPETVAIVEYLRAIDYPLGLMDLDRLAVLEALKAISELPLDKRGSKEEVRLVCDVFIECMSLEKALTSKSLDTSGIDEARLRTAGISNRRGPSYGSSSSRPSQDELEDLLKVFEELLKVPPSKKPGSVPG